jgi:O-antigen ligase
MYITFVTIAIGLWGRGRPLWRWICLTAIFGISVFVTFQRMPWAVFLSVVLGVLVIRWWNNPRWRNLGGIAGGIVLVFMIWVPWSELFPRYLPQEFVAGRLLEDTLTGRLAFNRFAVSLIPKYPLGLGETIASPVYNQEFYNYGLGLRSGGIGYTVHNGFLSATVRFGIAGGLAFGCMLFGFLLVSARRAVASNSETLIVPLIAAVLILYNLTEDFASAGGQTILIGGLLMGCFVGQRFYHSLSHNRNIMPASHWIKSKASDRVLSDA